MDGIEERVGKIRLCWDKSWSGRSETGFRKLKDSWDRGMTADIKILYSQGFDLEGVGM